MVVPSIYSSARTEFDSRRVQEHQRTQDPQTADIITLVRGDAVRRLMETKSERGRGLAYSVTFLKALRRGHAVSPNHRGADDARGSSRRR